MTRKGSTVSYSMQEPEWPPVCECKYDEIRDKVDREDCPLHSSTEEKLSAPAEDRMKIKKPGIIAKRKEENAA